MTIYIVSCYSPPSALKIKKGDSVKVEGWMQKKNIRADRIENLTERGLIYECGIPGIGKIVTILPKSVTKAGTVKKVTITTESIEFELECSE